MSVIPLDLQSKISAWRLKAADGTLTEAEMKEAITYLRAGRVSAIASTAKKSVKAIAPVADDMLSELDGL